MIKWFVNVSRAIEGVIDRARRPTHVTIQDIGLAVPTYLVNEAVDRLAQRLPRLALVLLRALVLPITLKKKIDLL